MMILIYKVFTKLNIDHLSPGNAILYFGFMIFLLAKTGQSNVDITNQLHTSLLSYAVFRKLSNDPPATHHRFPTTIAIYITR